MTKRTESKNRRLLDGLPVYSKNSGRCCYFYCRRFFKDEVLVDSQVRKRALPPNMNKPPKRHSGGWKLLSSMGFCHFTTILEGLETSVSSPSFPRLRSQDADALATWNAQRAAYVADAWTKADGDRCLSGQTTAAPPVFPLPNPGNLEV